jgi:hypothetical protein
MTTFQTKLAATFDGDVNITVPGQDEPAVLSLTFTYRDRDQLQFWLGTLKDRSDDEVIPECVEGWRNVMDGEKAVPVPYSAEALRDLVLKRFHSSAQEIYQAYLKLLRESRAKN